MYCRSIAQGCSEYNITVLIDQKDSVRALRAVHGRFYLATLPLGVGLVGPGLIGGTFLDQIHQQMTVCCLAYTQCRCTWLQPCWLRLMCWGPKYVCLAPHAPMCQPAWHHTVPAMSMFGHIDEEP